MRRKTALFLGLAVAGIGAAKDLPKPAIVAPVQDQQDAASIVPVREDRIVYLHARYGKEITIKAPDGEQFISYDIGDLMNWPHTQPNELPSPFFSIRPAFPKKETTLHLMTDHRNLYSFDIKEDQERTDITVLLKSGDESITKRINDKPAYVAYSEVEGLKQQLAEMTAQVEREKVESQNRAQAEIQKFEHSYPAQVQVNYTFDRDKAAKPPYSVTDIWHDDSRTFIKHDPKTGDLPAIYGLTADGKQQLVPVRFDPGTNLYTIDRVLQAGYITAGGKHKIEFKQN